MKEALEKIVEYLPPILLAACGGVVRTLRVILRGEKYSFWKALVETVTAGFVGLIVHFGLQETSVSPNIQAMLIAMSGYIASEIMPALETYATSKILAIFNIKPKE